MLDKFVEVISVSVCLVCEWIMIITSFIFCFITRALQEIHLAGRSILEVIKNNAGLVSVKIGTFCGAVVVKFGTFIDIVFQIVRPLWSIILTKISTFIDVVVSLISIYLGKILNITNILFEKIWILVTKIASTSVKIGNLLSIWCYQQIIIIMDKLVEWILPLIKATASSFWKNLVKPSEKLILWIYNMWIQNKEHLKKKLKEVLSQIWSCTNIIFVISKWTCIYIKEIFEWIWPLIKATLNLIWKLFKAIVHHTKAISNIIWTQTKSIMKIIWNLIKSILKCAWIYTKQISEMTWSGIKTSLKLIWTFIKPIAVWIWNFIKAITRKFETIVNSFWENKKVFAGWLEYFTYNILRTVYINIVNTIALWIFHLTKIIVVKSFPYLKSIITWIGTKVKISAHQILTHGTALCDWTKKHLTLAYFGHWQILKNMVSFNLF